MDAEMLSPQPADSELGFDDAEMLADDDSYVQGRDEDASTGDWVGVPMEEDADAGDADYVVAEDGHVADAADLLPMDAETAPVVTGETLEAEPELDLDGPVAAEEPAVDADEADVPLPGPLADVPPLEASSEPILAEPDAPVPEATAAPIPEAPALPTPPVRPSLASALLTGQASLPGSPVAEPLLPRSSAVDAPQPVVRRDLLDHLPVADVPPEVGGLRSPAAPAIRLSFRGQDEVSLFRSAEAEPSTGLVVYDAESSKIYYDVLTALFVRLRDIFSPLDKEVDPSELTLEVKELDIKINEAELEDLHRLFRAYHDDAPFVIHIGLRVRFVLRLNQLAEFALKPPEGDEALGAPAAAGAEDSLHASDEDVGPSRPVGAEDDGVVDETGQDADEVADIATEGEDGDEPHEDEGAAEPESRAALTPPGPELATETINTRSVDDLLGDGSADVGDLDGTDAVDTAAFELEAADTALDADAPTSTEQRVNGDSSSPTSHASSTTLARPDDDAADLDSAADPSGSLSVPGSAFNVASSAAEVAAALHPSKSGKGPISPKRSRDDLVDENDPQNAKRPRAS